MTEPIGFSPELERDMKRAASAIRSSDSVLVVSHIDADGISAGAIAAMTLDRLGIDRTVVFEKKMTDDTIERINSAEEDTVWICDLGSAYLSEFKKAGTVITDHHMPDPKWRKNQTFIDDFCDIHHLNPHAYGVSGSHEVCGAGMTYILSRTLDPGNADLAFLAVIGAVGDFQDSRESCLTGYNRIILKDAVDAGDVVPETDIRFFGRENRPLTQFLQYGGDPSVPGITDDSEGCQKLFRDLDVRLKDGSAWRTWNDLDRDEKTRITEELLSRTGDADDRKRLYGEVYTLPRFKDHTGLRDAKEYATILNSCGRYDDAETGLRICMGDLDALENADRNRSDHRRNISAALSHVRENHLIRERRFIQYFDAGPEIRDTIVGIVAGMLLNSGEARRELPIFAFAEADDGVKVSARSTRNLTDRGLDLSAIMKTASELVGGFGGGHDIAAGATIPKGKEEAFLDIVEDLVSSQII